MGPVFRQPETHTEMFSGRPRRYVGSIRACKLTHTAQVSLIYLKHQLNAGCTTILLYTAHAEFVLIQISEK